MLVIFVVGLVVSLLVLWSRLKSLQERVEWLERSIGWVGEAPAVRQPAVAIGESLNRETASVQAFAAPLEEPTAVAMDEATSDAGIESPERRSVRWSERFSFEDIFGRRLPIWAGGITLAIAGLLIVQYSIDAGLLSPSVRVMGGLLFGMLLIGAAELAYRFEKRVGDERVRQALAGAGIATLYGAILVAANIYGLIGAGLAFGAMAAITVLAIGLSLRFGAPSAMLGLAGGLAAPALVGSDNPSIPLLTGYLALTIGALGLVSRRQEWLWLRAAALAGGFGWTAFLLVNGTLDQAGSVSVGLLMLAIGFVFPSLRGRVADDRLQWLTGVMAAGQVAALVASGGFTMLHWGLFGLLSAAVLWLSASSPAHARLPAVGLAVVLMLMVAWPAPDGGAFAIVMAGAIALYGGWAFTRLWKPGGSMVEAGSLAALGLSAMFTPWLHFGSQPNPALLGLAGTAASLIPGIGAFAGWRQAERRTDARFAVLVMATAATLAGAAMIALAGWAVAPALAVLAVMQERVMAAAGDRRLRPAVVAMAIVCVLALLTGDGAFDQWARLFGETASVAAVAALRWMLVAAALAWLSRSALPRKWCLAFQAAAALAAYGALAQVVGGAPLATVAALMTAALALSGAQKWVKRWRPAAAALLTVTAAWMIEPLMAWLGTGAESLAGQPFLVGPLDLAALGWRLAIPALLLALAVHQAAHRMSAPLRRAMLLVGGAAGLVVVHLLFKQLFGIANAEQFVDRGVAERAVWEALLLIGATLALKIGRRKIALALAGAGLLHATLYSMLWHNPLWSEQWVGALPIFNLLVIANAPPLIALWLFGRIGVGNGNTERVRLIAPALPIALLSYSLLRQAIAGPILNGPGVTSAEDIGRSVVAVMLGIGFLLWGIARNARDWRILSLAVMVAAVGKVFLFDAAGLEGLARIGSFLALGLSLIGIGWLYSRFLRADDLPSSAQQST
jgi:uncharacterized membrane protein